VLSVVGRCSCLIVGGCIRVFTNKVTVLKVCDHGLFRILLGYYLSILLVYIHFFLN